MQACKDHMQGTNRDFSLQGKIIAKCLINAGARPTPNRKQGGEEAQAKSPVDQCRARWSAHGSWMTAGKMGRIPFGDISLKWQAADNSLKAALVLHQQLGDIERKQDWICVRAPQ